MAIVCLRFCAGNSGTSHVQPRVCIYSNRVLGLIPTRSDHAGVCTSPPPSHQIWRGACVGYARRKAQRPLPRSREFRLSSNSGARIASPRGVCFAIRGSMFDPRRSPRSTWEVRGARALYGPRVVLSGASAPSKWHGVCDLCASTTISFCSGPARPFAPPAAYASSQP